MVTNVNKTNGKKRKNSRKQHKVTKISHELREGLNKRQ